MIRVWFCDTCDEMMTGREAIVSHEQQGHMVERLALHRRERRSGKRVEVQWSTDWVPRLERVE